MTDIKRVGDTGIHTVEGNIAGARAARLTKQREVQKAEYEAIKNKIKEQNSAAIGRIDDKFNAASDSLEQEFRRRTVGLVSAEDFRKARELVKDAQTEHERRQEELEQQAIEDKKREKALKRKKMSATLSFGLDEEEAVEEVSMKPPKKLAKDPNVETSFLPDRERDLALDRERKRLQEEWLAEQEKIKNETLEITYSYWDGMGHRKVIQVKKGLSIGKFLELVKQQISSEFSNLRAISAAENLLYIKEDLIIPHHITFYDMIITKARGKSGPLFHFDVHDDVRLMSDARVEKDESHPGKVVERRWYERNKHIFPASRWEVYDPSVTREASYTIHGDEVQNRK